MTRWPWLFRRRRNRDLEEEIRSHLRMAAEDCGEDAARREFGNSTLIQEVTREMWGWNSLDQLWQDVRYALRTMGRNPGFTAVAVLSLALGIGANTAIFSLIDALLLRSLPVPNPQQLVEVMIVQNGKSIDSFSYPVVRALADQKQIFSALCGFSGAMFNVGSRNAVERTPGAWVSGEYYQTLGLQPVAGRLLARDDDQPGAVPVAVITDEYWQRKYGRDPNAIGKAIPIEGVPVAIVGVSPAGFTGANVGQVAEITLPLAANTLLMPELTGRLSAASEWLRILARPQPSVSISQAKARLAVRWPQLVGVAVTPRTPPARRKMFLSSTLDLIPGTTGWTSLRSQFQRPLLVLMALVGMVLLIACANVANLLLARAQARQREIAVRLAIGASRARLMRQLLTESVLLACFGSVVAILAALLASRQLVQLLSTWHNTIFLDLTLNWHVLEFTAALALATGIVFGIAPAISATAARPSPALKEVPAMRTGLNSALVAAQVAVSFVLLIAAGLFVRTLQNLDRLDPGFRSEGVLLIEGDLHRAVNPARIPVYQEVLRKIEHLPGVVSASLAANMPLSGGFWTDGVIVNGQPAQGQSVHFNSIAPHYFDAMGTRLLAGRDFTDRDDESSPVIAIVNEAFVERYFPDGHPLGQRISAAGMREFTDMQITGVVQNAISQTLREPPPPAIYVPFYQRQTEFPTIVVHASGSLIQTTSALRRELQSQFPASAIQIHTLTAQVESALVRERLMAALAASFGALAIVLAAIGLYGLLAYSVARRTSELGIRMALGAGRGQVVWLVIRDALKLLAWGVLIGLPAAWAGSRWIKSMLFGLTTNDPTTIVAAAALLVGVGLLAGYLPARRASRADPMAALRYE